MTTSSANPANRDSDVAGMAAAADFVAVDVAADEEDDPPVLLAVVVVDGALSVSTEALDVANGVAGKLLDDDTAIFSSGDMTCKTGVFCQWANSYRRLKS
jgi:hypothetical protein